MSDYKEECLKKNNYERIQIRTHGRPTQRRFHHPRNDRGRQDANDGAGQTRKHPRSGARLNGTRDILTMNKELIIMAQEVALTAVELELIGILVPEERKRVIDAARTHLKKGQDALV